MCGAGLTTVPRAGGNLMAIEFICVRLNGAVNEVCASCKSTITDKAYVRELSTRIIYHNQWCMEAHKASATKALEHHDVAVHKEDFYR